MKRLKFESRLGSSLDARRLTVSALFAGALGLFISGHALAASECTTDEDCGHGFSCDPAAQAICNVPECKPGTECAPTVCEAGETGQCVPRTGCEDDTDCAPGMGCQIEEYESCSGSACAPGADCVPSEPVCTTGKMSQCVPSYQLPCSQAADCGDGFDCVAEPCDCGAPAEADAGLAVPELVACDCSATNSLSYCEAKQIECQSDEQCPSDWHCGESPSAGGVSVPSEAPTGIGASVDAGSAVESGGSNGGAPSTENTSAPIADDSADDGAGDDVWPGPVVEDAGAPAPQTRYCVPPYGDVHNTEPTAGGVDEGSGSVPPTAEEPGDAAADDGPGEHEVVFDAGANPGRPESEATEQQHDEDASAPSNGGPESSNPSSAPTASGADNGHDGPPVSDDADASDSTEDTQHDGTGTKSGSTSKGDQNSGHELPEADAGATEGENGPDYDDGCAVAAASRHTSLAGSALLGLAGLALIRRRKR
ncbi:MAG TPA: hypothetical protein VHM70_25010 [Polyangiaceae bacterium]|nr:hypothetical protein [Polyangiaceae bacterium]